MHRAAGEKHDSDFDPLVRCALNSHPSFQNILCFHRCSKGSLAGHISRFSHQGQAASVLGPYSEVGRDENAWPFHRTAYTLWCDALQTPFIALDSHEDVDFLNQVLQQRGKNILTLQGPRMWPPTHTKELRNSKIHSILKPPLDC